MIVVSKISILTGARNAMELPLTDAEFKAGEARRDMGELVQDVYPNLTMWQREFLINGTTEQEHRDHNLID